MSKHDKYLTFPIAFLQLRKSLDDVTMDDAAKRMAAIVAWCLREATLQNLRDLGSDNGKLQAIAERHPRYDETEGTEEDVAFLAAMDTLGWNTNSFKGIQSQAGILEKSVILPAGKKLARVRSDAVSQVMNGGIEWRDFAVLVAICAGCFDMKKRKAVSLKMAQLGTMALGYGSASHCHKNDADGLQISDKAIGRTVEKLRNRRWFVKASPDNGRNTYYSNSLSETQMITYVSKIKADKIQKKTRSLSEIQKQVNATAVRMATLTTEQRRQLEGIDALARERRRASQG